MENTPIEIENMQSGEIAAVSREQSEIQSAIMIAKKYPRNEAAAFVKLMKSLDRPAMAEAAQYSFKRGKKDDGTPNYVTGPSVDLAREAARCWGNIRAGLRIVSTDEEFVHFKGYAYDVETNTLIESEGKVRQLIQRKVYENGVGITRWVKPDERDLREMINRQGAIAVRNCILQVLPADLIQDAIKKSDEVYKKAQEGKLQENREDTIKALVVEYDKIGVTVEMLTRYLGHDIKTIDAAELADLRQTYKAIFTGHAKREEIFDLVAEKTASDLNSSLGLKEKEKPASKKKKDPEPEPKPVIAKQQDPQSAEIPIG